jgi:hypothetical protein
MSVSPPGLAECPRVDLNHRPPPCQGGEHSAAPRGPSPAGRSRTYLAPRIRRVPDHSATAGRSKDGRSRTLCVRVGAALLSREHVLGIRGPCVRLESPSAEAGKPDLPTLGPPFPWNCPGRIRTHTPPVNSGPHHHCATGQAQSGRQDLNLRSRDSQPRDHSGLVHVLNPGKDANRSRTCFKPLCRRLPGRPALASSVPSCSLQ